MNFSWITNTLYLSSVYRHISRVICIFGLNSLCAYSIRKGMSCKATAFDIVVLGAGSAGCAAARSIALQHPGAAVCLIEQGCREPPPLTMRVPLLSPLIGSFRNTRRFLRFYRGIPEDCLGGRQLHYMKGRGLGGSSWCNDMKYLRGTAEDYNSWGDAAWEMEQVLPFFKALECNSRIGASEHHGDSGPLVVTDPPAANVNSELNIRWFEACEALGIPQISDFNSGTSDGFSCFQSHINKGARVDVFDSLLESERHLLPNLTIFSDTRANRIVFDKSRAVGIEVIKERSVTVLPIHRLVLCLGALESPALLLRSGIGPRGDVAELPGVGQNLIQSCSAVVVFRISRSSNLHSKSLSFSNGAYLRYQWREYTEERSGIFASFAEAGAFVRSTPSAARPDLSLTFYPTPNVRWCGWRPFDGFAVRVTHHYPEARGEVVLGDGGGSRSSVGSDGEVQIASRMLSARHDVQCMDEGLRWVGSLCSRGGARFQQPAPFAPLGTSLQHPATGLSTQRSTAAFLAQYAESTGDIFGTCALGTVVDGTLRVRGVEGIHVADASVVPVPTCGSSSVIGAVIGSRVGSFLAK
uniref:Uncharacterized protein TCIL3000_11_10030 n=1 Tax=Trypanosoma congolense (strain IL3000) TaxID=1068625 RepID=G0V1L0_TRYCI|nr:unnamed protein product [Trypanosoma congolense IL3000]